MLTTTHRKSLFFFSFFSLFVCLFWFIYLKHNFACLFSAFLILLSFLCCLHLFSFLSSFLSFFYLFEYLFIHLSIYFNLEHYFFFPSFIFSFLFFSFLSCLFKTFFLSFHNIFQNSFFFKLPALFKSGQLHFNQDNAPVHNSILVTDSLTKIGIKTVPYPPYSPDHAPCDFWLFPKLRGYLYETNEELKEAVTKVIDMLTQEDFHGAFQKLLERYDKCIAAGGDYFEGN